MAERSRGMLFRKRNVLGAALVAGIGVGLYLGKLPGIGNGGNGFFGFGVPTNNKQAESDGDKKSSDAVKPLPAPVDSTPANPDAIPADVIRIAIDEHKYLIQSNGKEIPIALSDLVDHVRKATGDVDGIKLKIFEKETARAKAEEDLKAALADAQIDEKQVLWLASTPSK